MPHTGASRTIAETRQRCGYAPVRAGSTARKSSSALLRFSDRPAGWRDGSPTPSTVAQGALSIVEGRGTRRGTALGAPPARCAGKSCATLARLRSQYIERATARPRRSCAAIDRSEGGSLFGINRWLLRRLGRWRIRTADVTAESRRPKSRPSPRRGANDLPEAGRAERSDGRSRRTERRQRTQRGPQRGSRVGVPLPAAARAAGAARFSANRAIRNRQAGGQSAVTWGRGRPPRKRESSASRAERAHRVPSGRERPTARRGGRQVAGPSPQVAADWPGPAG